MLRAFIIFLLAMAHAGSAQEAVTLARVQSGNWNAVGRIEIADKGFCTGTLIAPDVVLTAAHCLFHKTSGARFEARDLIFKAGYQHGDAVAQSTVARTVVNASYNASNRGELANLRHDVAVLQLSQPLTGPHLTPLTVGAPDLSGAKAGVLSYGQGRAEALQVQQSCDLSAHPKGVIVTNCLAALGTSGAPVLQATARGVQIVSLVSAMARADGQPVALAVAPAAAVQSLLAQLGAQDL